MPDGGSYRSFIESAYIDPIRTVILVDDEYPSLDSILGAVKSTEDDAGYVIDGNEGDVIKSLNENKRKCLDLIRYCRNRENPWIFDVRNVKGVDEESEYYALSHLHQCDFLILDHNLRHTEDDGDLSIKIIQKISKNKHFNLIAVYTNEDAETAFQRTIRELMPTFTHGLNEDELREIRDLIFEWSDIEPDFYDEVIKQISDEYLQIRELICQNEKLQDTESYKLNLSWYLKLKKNVAT